MPHRGIFSDVTLPVLSLLGLQLPLTGIVVFQMLDVQ